MAININSTNSRTKNGNQIVVVKTDYYSKLRQAMAISKNSTSCFVAITLDYWIVLRGILSSLLAYNGSELVATLFKKWYLDLELERRTTTAYHLDENGQERLCNRTLITRLRY